MRDEVLVPERYVAGIFHTKDILEYVDAKLNEGIWSEVFLEIMDCENNGWADISLLFEKYLKEIGVTLPDLETAVRRLVEYHIIKIYSGNVVPYEQFKVMLQEIDAYDYFSKTKNYVGDDLGIHRMYGWYYEDCATVHEVNQGILEGAIEWVSNYGKTH